MMMRATGMILLVMTMIFLGPLYGSELYERSYLVRGIQGCVPCGEEIVQAVKKLSGVESASFPELNASSTKEVELLVVVHRGDLDDNQVIRVVEGVKKGVRCEVAPQ